MFDFAPDRTLKMVAESAALSTKAGKANESDRRIMGEFLNYCPVIAVDGTVMKAYDTNRLLQQLKRAYAERAVQNGFDDTNLYNDELLRLEELDIEKFNNLKKIVGTSKAAPKAKEIDINAQGFTDEEYEELGRIEKKPKRERTLDEEKRLQEMKEKQKLKNNAISILRGISIRMPLLIYGADIPIDEDITMEKLVDIVDDSSWEEFMPSGVTKEMFKSFIKYYDPEIFVAAGRRIRTTVLSADELSPTERVKKIAQLFACFKNPDKETVLTPWRVVNMHMSDCLGGYDFYDEAHEQMVDAPRFVEHGKVTADTFANAGARVLEINSKTGLYPLYVTYSIFRSRCATCSEEELDDAKLQQLWDAAVRENVFVICKTPMAKQITRRTLAGYRDIPVNAHYFDDLINMMKNKPRQFVDRVLKPSYWKQEGVKTMKFDAVVGNPPYQSMTNGGSDSGRAARQAAPIFNYFVEQAKMLEPGYVSMIIPARWYNGGIGLNAFRADMLNDKHLTKLVDFANSKDCFTTVDISGGLCYFLWERDHEDECLVINMNSGEQDALRRSLNQYGNLFIRSNKAISIIEKIRAKADSFVDEMVSAIDTFGIPSKVRGHEEYKEGDILLVHSDGANSSKTSYISRDVVTKNAHLIDKYKVRISILVPQNGEAGVKPEKGYRSMSTPHLVYPGQVDSFSYLNIGFFDNETEAENFRKYMMCKLPRFMMRTTYSSAHISQSNFIFVPKMDYTRSWTDPELYEHFGLSDEEIKLVETTMRPMAE